MPKFLIQADFSQQGEQGLLNAGGSVRVAAAKKAIESVGGTLESYYFSFGGHDAVVLADLPDNASAAAASLVVGASGAGRAHTTVLLTAEELDEAAKKEVSYDPPT